MVIWDWGKIGRFKIQDEKQTTGIFNKVVNGKKVLKEGFKTIEVKRKSTGGFLVIVDERGSKTEYNVELDSEYYQKLTRGNISEEELIRKSFQFLLKREPKESILSRFNLKVIKNYFPEYEEEIKKDYKRGGEDEDKS